jgi:hypothetical protein
MCSPFNTMLSAGMRGLNRYGVVGPCCAWPRAASTSSSAWIARGEPDSPSQNSACFFASRG